MRLIDADEYANEMKLRQDAVCAWIEHPRTDVYYTDKEHWEGILCTFAEAKLTLDNMPTVDAVPVVHGRWLSAGDHEACSVCGATHLKTVKTYFGTAIKAWVKTNYCSNCGAKMDGTEEDEHDNGRTDQQKSDMGRSP